MKARRGPQGDSTRHTVSKAEDDSFSQTPARLTEGHLDPEGCPWLVLSSARRQPALFPNLIPCQNELWHGGISGP